jgi:hypothetical protein
MFKMLNILTTLLRYYTAIYGGGLCGRGEWCMVCFDFGTHNENLGIMKVCAVGAANPFCLARALVFLGVIHWAYLVVFLFAV